VGGFANVYPALWGGVEVYVKVLHTSNCAREFKSMLKDEARWLWSLRHPNLLPVSIHMHGKFWSGTQLSCSTLPLHRGRIFQSTVFPLRI
jgi:hypothetical protein